MGLNKSGIDWTDYTFNPIIGCEHGCWYCYAREVAKRQKCPKCQRFEPHFHEERLKIPHGKPKTIFFGSMCDAWGDWVPKDWIEGCLTVMREHPEHTFLTLTKNPKRYLEFIDVMSGNLWCGATITNRDNLWDALPMGSMKGSGHNPLFLSFEPLLEDISQSAMFETFAGWTDAFIIGPLNKAGWDPVTKREWVENIIEIAQPAKVPVFLKGACVKIGYTMDEMESRGLRELPWNLHERGK